MASGDADGIVRIWDVKMVKEIMTFDCGKHAANAVLYDNSGSYVVVGGDDGIIRLYSKILKFNYFLVQIWQRKKWNLEL